MLNNLITKHSFAICMQGIEKNRNILYKKQSGTQNLWVLADFNANNIYIYINLYQTIELRMYPLRPM